MSQQINLFNPVFLKQRKIFTAAAMAQALGVLVIGIAALAWTTQRGGAELAAQAAQLSTQLEGRQASLQAAAAKLAPRKKSIELEARIAYLELQLQALREAGAVIERGQIGNTQGYAGYFRAFARQDTPGLWLTGLSIEGAGVDINIEGRALDAGLVPGYIGKLSGERVLSGKTFGSLRITTPSATPEAQAAVVRAAPEPVAPYVEFQLRAQPEKAGG